MATRFSVRSKTWNTPFSNEASRLDWMSWRAKLLDEGLAECLRQQSVYPHAAYLLLAEGDEEFYKRHVDTELFRPVFVPTGSESNASLVEALNRDGNTGEMVLSRVDSDDLLVQNYVESVQQSVSSTSDTDKWIVAADGQRSDLKKVQDFHYPNSPFISRFIKNRTSQSIYRNHQNVLDLDPITISGVLWWQLLHGSNLANRFWKPRSKESYDPAKRHSGELNDYNSDMFAQLFGFADTRLSEMLTQGNEF